MTSLARLTDLTDWTDLTDKRVNRSGGENAGKKSPLISRHDLFPAASVRSVMSVKSDKVRETQPPDLAP